ncbi:MAG: citrate lyase acyl carrier protein [Firmicutes bacterium]|uniref:Citrate lyase acyl carrier protein n=1 Tax=Candidatus Gallilactobacillus intestinavium TaxID=2840838 RepID=A0A9D9H882_9LACO|nr:citrate lyase acyl carrier protein [Candidatus Gallilactobacillus intestinavium]
MEISKNVLVGTLESSDIQIMLSAGNNGIQIDLDSPVMKKYGDQIKKVITDTLKAYHIDNANVKAVDKGALDCVIKARTITAAETALNKNDDPMWEAY